MRLNNASTLLVFAGAGIYFLQAATPLGAPQQGPDARPPSHSQRAHSTKPTWVSGPATTTPQTEVVLPRSAAPPRAKPPYVPSQAEGKGAAAKRLRAATPAGSRSLTRSPSASALEPASTANANLHDESSALAPEAQRIQDELRRLRQDAKARRTFYEQLRRTVERVRSGLPDEDPQKAVSPRPASFLSPQSPVEPSNSLDSDEPDEPPPAKPEGRQVSKGARGSLDRAAYQRVVHWAKANGAPVPLALAVAWMESHLQTNPARGAAGELGMFQILPERCRIEGWPSKRLKEPEFNAWMGTRLLARYYQEEGSWKRAAAKYVAGPAVFDRSYSQDLSAYINWYATSVNRYAGYFSRYQS